MPLQVIPDYRNLDLTGEARAAAERMEARSLAPASEAMFRELVAPLLSPAPRTVLEVGCGTAALSRRLARALPGARIVAADKSEGMLAAARRLVEAEGVGNVVLCAWDALDAAGFSAEFDRFELIVSSVVVPYLDDAQTGELVRALAARLVAGGTLAFIEQDLRTDSVNYPSYDLWRRVYAKDKWKLKPTLALGLRPLLRAAGLELLPRRSFLWTDEAYGPYTQELLGRFADSACEHGRITPAEREEWKATLRALYEQGDFYYGLVYHAIAGRRGAAGDR